jgi:hypothetical protein
MADGDLTVTLDSDTARRVKLVADEAGVSVQNFVTGLIADRLQTSVAEAEAAFEDFGRNGLSVDAEVALTRFQERVAARVAGT